MFYRHTPLFLAVFASSYVHVTEIDNLTHRNLNLRDVRSEVNQIVNDYLGEAVQKANQKATCDSHTLLNSLAKRIGTGFISNIEKEVERDKTIDQVFTKRRESIYSDFNFFEAPGIFFTNFGSLINVNGNIIGTDKLGHFLGTGFLYYKRVYYHGRTLAHAVKFGEKTERTYYGLMLNGVYSHADLAANFDGFSFWERVIGFSEMNAPEPYVLCKNNQWSLGATFDIADYVNSAWDEGINCNRYRSSKMHRKVSRRITLLEQNHAQSYQCPIAPQECENLIKRYGDYARNIITKACFTTY